MKYFLRDINGNTFGEANDVKTALQNFGEIYDEWPEVASSYTVEIYLEIGKEV